MELNLNQNILLKFVEPQFSESTLEGGLFFKQNDHFIELENKQLQEGIGDKHEGKWSRVLKPGTTRVFVTNENGKEIPITLGKGVFRETYSNLKKLPICCFVLLNLEKDFDIDWEDGSVSIKKELHDELRKQFVGRHMILFNDINEFLSKVETAFKKDDLAYMMSKVTYYDDENEEHPLSETEFNEKPYKSLFYKRKFFKNQKEYRIIVNKIDGDFILNIGDIKDIAFDLGEVQADKPLLKLKIQIHDAEE
jgi:hypothetical protein